MNRYFALMAILLLSACSSSHRPVYSGYEANTEGVPGFVNGYKVAPTVKLGQSYTVDGETYVPHYQPDYVEEGMASWYGPGFHGGKTANGEEFDKHELTAAHRTLPLPSIVRVTLLSTGKSAYVRINDRGPFSKKRIIDLSYGAADAIGLIGKGIDRVKVEYMPQESQRFADLLAQGREPQSINLTDEVIGHTTAYAKNDTTKKPSVWNRLNPVTTAHAEEPVASMPLVVDETTAAPESTALPEIESRDLMSPAKPPKPEILSPGIPVVTPALASAPVVVPGTYYLQLGAFLQQSNADKLRKKVANFGKVLLSTKPSATGATLYVIRMGPYTNVDESSRVLAQLKGLGINPTTVTK